MQSVRFIAAAPIITVFLLFCWPATHLLAQDSTYRATDGYDKVVAAMNRLQRDGDKLSAETLAKLKAVGQSCLDLEKRDMEGKYPLANEIKSYEQQGRALPADLQARIEAENNREAAKYAAFVRSVDQAFVRAVRINRIPEALRSLDRDKPVNANITTNTGNRSAGLLSDVVKQFDVENNPRYEPKKDKNGKVIETYCNIFVGDVTRAMGAEIPHMRANDMNTWLKGDEGTSHGWKPATPEEAQKYANEGRPSVVSWLNADPPTTEHPIPHGHIGIVRPGTLTDNGPAMAQAGSKNFNITHVKQENQRLGGKQPEYFIHE